MRVILADDHHVVREGIRALLEKSGDFEVVGEASDGQEAVDLVERLLPDVLVMDIAMPRLNGIEATRRIGALQLATRVVILSMLSDEALVRQALRSGARGYLLKQSVTEELVLAIHAASRGDTYLSPAISGIIVDDFLMRRPDSQTLSPLDRLTSREREVMQLIAEGHTNVQIAKTLNISVKTAESHRANLMDKLDIHDVAGLTRAAIKHGLIFLDT
jgi:DNA-binding NarL/FixJ family response regulator